ncbi:ceramide synthase 5-like [Octopus sinensis]|uniref:Ceramide synthase 5-like n=1 Tax=Octopus sinensis TaxID=2607531 RepID=A0A6P7TSL4_9MOLL|nr:ceramide synthase 5-like [Octopus sinensis]
MDTDYILQIFWHEKFWLPVGTSWTDLESHEKNVYYPRAADMSLAVLVAVVFLAFRYCYESLIIVPIGRYLGIREHQRKVSHNPVLEQVYRKNKASIDDTQMKHLIKETSMNSQHIKKWMRMRRLQDAPSTMLKFRECSWHLLFYTSACIYGIIILWDKHWVWHTEDCWRGWPNHNVGTDLYYYYLFELAFYGSLILSLLMDIKRKDLKVMIIHHVATIILLSMSWFLNFVRIGSLTLIVHDIVDPSLVAAKMAKYSKKQTLCEIVFGVFAALWMISRLGIYPFWVLRSVYFEIHDHVASFPSFIVFASLLFILQILHIVWTYMIIRIAFQKYTHGQINQDVRSDTEEEDDDDDFIDETTVPPVTNHVTSNNTPKAKRRLVDGHNSINQS